VGARDGRVGGDRAHNFRMAQSFNRGKRKPLVLLFDNSLKMLAVRQHLLMVSPSLKGRSGENLNMLPVFVVALDENPVTVAMFGGNFGEDLFFEFLISAFHGCSMLPVSAQSFVFRLGQNIFVQQPIEFLSVHAR
jgi:hypothetical protein